MSIRALQAWINERNVGELRDENGIWSFAYNPQWVSATEGYALSPALPRQIDPIVDSGSNRPVQWYFDNLLPEESVRVLLAKDAKVDDADAFGLLAYYGAESAGSLNLSGSAPEPETPDEIPLPDADLQARIENLPRVSLTAAAAKRMSLAGAQHKLAVIYRDNAIFEPRGSTPSTHILKPDHPTGDYPHSVINEYFAVKLAGALKLGVPNVYRRYLPAPIYLIDRFDRRRKGRDVERLHAIDACQALNLDRQFKYREASVERLRELAERCAVPAAARLSLYSWLVFNMLIGNSDAHLKNVSFLVTGRGIQPAPYYDLIAVSVYDTRTFDRNNWPATPLAWELCGRTTFGELTRASILEAAAVLGLAAETANRLLNAQLNRIETLGGELLTTLAAENARLVAERGELAATFAGETRCLRAILKIIIRDMVAKLSR
ncbi:MAG: type II toxin-antitoxin system HipA family toxin [Betaproteobacteria bacterium]|nr:type II toxin-antitoxin system HipA family toxin [Betaproteobacteria bacterium]